MQKCYTIILYILHLSLTYKQKASSAYMNLCVIAHIVTLPQAPWPFTLLHIFLEGTRIYQLHQLCNATTKLNLSHTNKSCYSQNSYKKQYFLIKVCACIHTCICTCVFHTSIEYHAQSIKYLLTFYSVNINWDFLLQFKSFIINSYINK